MATRRYNLISIDDADKDITYGGQWIPFVNFSVTPAGLAESISSDAPFPATLPINTPLCRTLHRTTGKLSSALTLTFEGGPGAIYGYSDYQASYEDSILEPVIKCFLDGVLISNIPDVHDYNWPVDDYGRRLCQWSTNTFGAHTVMLNISARSTASRAKAVYVDEIRIYDRERLSSVDTEIPMLVVNHVEAAGLFKYEPREARLPGADDSMVFTQFFQGVGSLSYKFTGTKLTWYGALKRRDISAKGFRQDTNASYSIDNATQTSFLIQDSDQMDRILIFETPELPFGTHHLNVTFHANTTNTPLTLSHIVVDNAKGETVTGVAPHFESEPPKTAWGAVGGGRVPLVVLLLDLVVLGFLFCWFTWTCGLRRVYRRVLAKYTG